MQMDMMVSTERSLFEMWQAWQRGTPVESDSKWKEDYAAFQEVMLAVRESRTTNCQYKHEAQLLAASAGKMWNYLVEQKDVIAEGEEIVLFRGICDDVAQDAQIELKKFGSFRVSDKNPLCYSMCRGVAQAFARKGSVPGLVYHTRVNRREIAFRDIWSGSKSNLDAEREVVVWHRMPICIPKSQVDFPEVQPGAPTSLRHFQRKKELGARWSKICEDVNADRS